VPPCAKELVTTQPRDREKLSEHDDVKDVTTPFSVIDSQCPSDVRRGCLFKFMEPDHFWDVAVNLFPLLVCHLFLLPVRNLIHLLEYIRLFEVELISGGRESYCRREF